MRTARLVLVAALVLLLAIAGAAVAKPHKGKGKGKGAASFVPATGEYLGTANYQNSTTAPVSGKVTKSKGKYYVQVFLSTVAKCSDGTQVPAGVLIAPQVKGKSFSLTESGVDSRTGGTNTYKLSGSFASANSFTGTGSKTTTADPSRPESKDCTTGTIRFSLHKKG